MSIGLFSLILALISSENIKLSGFTSGILLSIHTVIGLWLLALIVLIFFCGLSYSQKLSPVFKSAIIPGWGQLELENDKKHKMFMLIEFSSLTACFASYGFSKHLQNKYKSFVPL